MNNLLLPNNDFLYELLDMPFPSTISHDNNFTYMDSNPNNLNFLNTPHFQGNYNPYHDEPSINLTTESCTTVNSSANFAFQPSSDNPFLFTPLKKDVIFNWNDYGANSDHQVPTFRTISPSLSLGSEASCSFHRPVPVPVPIQDNAQSKYLQVVQGILSEVTSYVLADTTDSLHELNIEPSPKAISGVSSNDKLASEEVMEGKIVQQELNAQGQELLNLLQLIDDRYNKCLDQIQNISSKFTNCTGSNETGTVHAPFAHVVISSRYKNLRERITKEIISISQQNVSKKHENEKEKGFELSFITKWASQQKEKIKRTESQCWRPQRGLPEKSVSVLRAWMFQNFLRPYPNDNEKDLLATKAGLSRSQVSNWFINARVRLWKPMIEEMYAELSKIKETEDISLNQGSSSK